MNDGLVEKVNFWAEKNCVMKPDTHVIVGVSGGADSVCLLHILFTLSKTRLFIITAVHINHMLRGKESDEDELFVKDLCSQYDITLKVFREDITTFSLEQGCSIEEAGRIIRYRRFQEVLSETSANYIAVAHHSDDQSETIFLNILRGTGLDGLCGMSSKSGQIIRPLLNVSKDEIQAYIKRNALLYRTDSSNLDNIYLRNSLRNVIFPEINEQTGTNITSSLLRMQKLLKSDSDFLNEYATEKYKNIVIFEDEKTVLLQRSQMIQLHEAISSRVIRIAWEKLTGSYKGLESVHVSFALEVIAGQGNKIAQLPKGIRAITQYDTVKITKELPEKNTQAFSIGITIPSTIYLPVNEDLDDRKIKVETQLYSRDDFLKRFGEIKKPKESGFVQLFDYDSIKKGIYIRNRLPGDVFSPYKGSGGKKLKDFFIDRKIPKNTRDKIPLLANGKDIVWVVGHRTSDKYKISNSTKTILYVNITWQI